MIDKNGKIGGKINLIDLLIIIVLVAVVVFVSYRFLIQDDAGIVNPETVTLQFTSAETKNFVTDRLETGVNVLDLEENNSMGTVTNIEIGEAYAYVVTDDGETVQRNAPDCSSVIITTKTNGTLDGNGVVIGGARYAVGHSMVIYVGDCKLYVQISAVDAA